MKKNKILKSIFYLHLFLLLSFEGKAIIASIDDDPVKGEEDAPVIMVEFSDFECSFCANFAKTTFQKIKENYIDRGLLKFVFRDFPIIFHPLARDAAKAANCAGRAGKYWEMHDILFSTQQLFPPLLKEHAKNLGLNVEEFENCMNGEDAEKEILKDMNDAKEYGIRGTPFFIIGENTGEREFEGETITGARPYEEFKKIIDSHLRLKRVYFDTASSSLSPSSVDVVRRNAEWLKRHNEVKVLLEGHCDERGNDTYNEALGLKRAQEVKKYLTEFGISDSRIEIRSEGEKKPLDPEHNENAWKKNRRVEFIIKLEK